MWDGFEDWLVFWGVYWCLAPLLPGDPRSLNIVSPQKVRRVVFFNCLISLPASLLLFHLCPPLFGGLPTFLRWGGAFVLMDGWFYYAHRLLHHPRFYPWHKQHHTFNYTYPMVAVYCSLTEALLCDFLSNALPAALFGLRGYEGVLWAALLSFNALKLHSTLDFGWVRGGEHGFHHGQQVSNFGLLSIFDKLHGTYHPTD